MTWYESVIHVLSAVSLGDVTRFATSGLKTQNSGNAFPPLLHYGLEQSRELWVQSKPAIKTKKWVQIIKNYCEDPVRSWSKVSATYRFKLTKITEFCTKRWAKPHNPWKTFNDCRWRGRLEQLIWKAHLINCPRKIFFFPSVKKRLAL